MPAFHWPLDATVAAWMLWLTAGRLKASYGYPLNAAVALRDN